MSSSRLHDLQCIARGAQMVTGALLRSQLRTAELRWQAGSVKAVVEGLAQKSADAASATSSSVSDGTLASTLQSIGDRSFTVAEGLRQGAPILLRRFWEEAAPSAFRGAAADQTVSDMDPYPPQTKYSLDGTAIELMSYELESDSDSDNDAEARYATQGMDVAASATGPSSMGNQQSQQVGFESLASPKPTPFRPVKDIHVEKQALNPLSQEKAVPASRLARLYNYGTLGVGLGLGAAAEVVGRTLGVREAKSTGAMLSDSPFLTEANAERIVQTLCRVRGAALKLGQMLSIQDNALIHPQVQAIFERVRYAADFMPTRQVYKVLEAEYGIGWENRFVQFDEKPFAAASIGQVHRAVLPDGQEVALKIQYPGVAESIDSDINNLVTLLNYTNMIPKGLYLESFVRIARKELAYECNYIREADCARRFAGLLAERPEYRVPRVFGEHTTQNILCTELIEGLSLDKCTDLDQDTRNWIGGKILELCLREVFEYRVMQSDPNWANFFYDPKEGQIVLLDFGATIDYSKSFVDTYMKLIRSAANLDKELILKYSREAGFLTGYEPKVMNEAHIQTVLVLGEAFASVEPLRFGEQQITAKVTGLMPTMLQHRLTPPPPESYSIHRKLSGAFLLCAKLNCIISCKPMFESIYADYTFGSDTVEG